MVKSALKNNQGLYCILVVLGLMVSFSSCSDDDDWNKEHTIKYVVKSNTPDVPIVIDAEGPNGYLYIKDYWEKTVKNNHDNFQLVARCKDRTVLMTGEIYIDGKLRATQDANSILLVGASLE